MWVRHQSKPRLIWVDALCINQADDEEKNAQVKQMHRIYSQAHVIHWLSNGDEISSLDTTLPLMERMMATWYFSETAMPSVLYLEQLWRRTGDGTGTLKDLPWLDLCQLFSLPYWTRVWIVQECLFGKSHEARIGYYDFTLEMYAASALLVWRLLPVAERVLAKKIVDEDIVTFRLTVDAIRESTLGRTEIGKERFPILFHEQPHQIIRGYSNHRCSDPRDHVYGFVPLLLDSQLFPVDYGLGVVDVFVDFTVYCMSRPGTLDPLSDSRRQSMYRQKDAHRLETMYEGTRLNRKWTPGLPSWCPDWAGPQQVIRELERDRWNASPGRSLAITRRSRLSGDLGIKGITVTTVIACSVEALGMGEGHWADDVRSAEDVALALLPTTPGKQLWRLFLVVLLVGKSLDRIPGLAKWTKSIPRRNKASVALKKLGPAWLERFAKRLFEHSGCQMSSSCHRNRMAIAALMNKEMEDASHVARTFTTASGLLGTGPHGMQEGDVVCVLFGGRVPFVVRPIDGKGRYAFIGEAFVHGLMLGEALNMGLPEQELLLV